MNKIKPITMLPVFSLLLMVGCQHAEKMDAPQEASVDAVQAAPAPQIPTLQRTALLPQDAQTYVRISNTSSFWERIKLSPLGKLWADQQFQDFIGNPESEVWEEMFLNNGPDAEREVVVEQLKMLQGEVILAFEPSMEDPYIIAAMSESDFRRSLEMDTQLLEITDEPFEIIRSTFQDVEIVQHIEKGGTPEELSSWQAHVGTTFLMGHKKEWVERCIVRLKEEAVMEPEGHPTCNMSLPLADMIRQFIEEEPKDATHAGDSLNLELLFEALGLMGVDNFSFKVELKQTEMIADSTLRVSNLNKGLFTILDLQPSELPTVGFIPGNITSIEVGRFNLLRFWQEIPNVLTTAMPSSKPQFDILLAMIQQQAGVHLEQDMLANIGTEYFYYSVDENNLQTSVIAVELNDSRAFKSALETLLAAPVLQGPVDAGLEIEELLNHTVYSLKNVDPSDAVAFSIAGDYFIYGQPDGIRQVIRSESSDAPTGESYEHLPLIKGLRQHVPARAFGFGAIDWKKHMSALVHELNDPERFHLMFQNWAKSGYPLPPPDISKLPPADHMASFFNVSYQYAEATDEGIHQRIILKY